MRWAAYDDAPIWGSEMHRIQITASYFTHPFCPHFAIQETKYHQILHPLWKLMTICRVYTHPCLAFAGD